MKKLSKFKKNLLVLGMIGASVAPFAVTTNPVMAAEKTITIDGTQVSAPAKGYKWVVVNGKTYFIQNGNIVKGWKVMDKSVGENTTHMSYFHPKTGELYAGWHQMGALEGEKTEHMSYFGSNGWLRTGWQEMGNGTSNSYSENKSKHWSYFGENGWLRTGWQMMGTASNPDGKNKAHWSYFGDNGWLRTGWQQMGKGTNNAYGENTTQHWSYFGNNGWLRTGWQWMGKGTNNSFGENTTKHESFFNGQGWLKTNAWEGDWYFNGNGWKVGRSGIKGVYPNNGRKTIIIGDSRTVGSYQAAGGTGGGKSGGVWQNLFAVNGNERWIAKVGAGYSWFTQTAIPKAESYGIDGNTDVIVLLGVNDGVEYNNTSKAQSYANTLNAKANTWSAKGARVYYVSVNPIRGNNYHANWNNAIKGKLNNKIKYIDTTGVGFNFEGDGLHYKANTNKSVMWKVLRSR